MEYWAERLLKAQENASEKTVKQIEKQLAKYYSKVARSVIADFEATYDKILASVADGRSPTPADLYKLDKYWQMQGELRRTLQKMGDKQIVLLSKKFEENWAEIYELLAIKDDLHFGKADRELARQMINHIWCADGKSWSQRVWDNISKLQQTLNDGLIECVVTGKKTTQLKQILQERFNVSYSQADTLVRTEMAQIQTSAARQRYEDYGLTQYEILGNEDDSCGGKRVDCHKMHGKVFYYSEMQIGKNAPPFHPNCKCAIMPVIN